MKKTALIAGLGALPGVLVAALAARGEDFVVAALDGFAPDLPGRTVETFRLERLVPFLERLQDAGVTDICLAGAVRRPRIEPELFDARTATLVPRLVAAMQPGDDATLRIFMEIFEEFGFGVRAAHEIAPELLPHPGVATRAAPAPRHESDAELGEVVVERMGRSDTGQACVVAAGRIIATEGPDGTDAMLRALVPHDPDRAPMTGDAVPALDAWAATAMSGTVTRADTPARHGILFKAPKPTQDRRADLPVIGPATAMLAAEAGLDGLVIEAGGVMVIDMAATRQALDAMGMFLWVRPGGFRR